jgi:DUF4097 and DUF4098 domain-containing protein YvlB
MRKFVLVMALTCLFAGWIVAGTCCAKEQWEFSKVSKIKVKGVSGDVVIRPADSNTGMVKLSADVHPHGSFHPEVEQDGKTLYIKEKWGHGSSSGEVTWTIYIPQQDETPRINISTASGNLDCSKITARIDFSTASGEVELSEVELEDGSEFSTVSGDYVFENMTISEGVDFSTASGDIELVDLTVEKDCNFSTASGDIKCIDCKGYLELSSASGDVMVKNPKLLGEGEFSSASGDVALHLSKLPKNDVSASSASGNVLLDVENFGDDFTLVLIKRDGKGRISCPFDYTDEKTFEDYHVYEKKIVKRGSGRPEIRLRTASGKVIVKD